MNSPIGTAVNCDAGIAAALDTAVGLGCTATQIMFREPMSYKRKTPLPAEDTAALWDIVQQGGMAAACHASIWCILTRDPSEGKQKMSNATIAEDIRLASRYGVVGTVVHPGSWTSRAQGEDAVANINSILDTTPNSPALLLVENSASLKALHTSPAAITATLERCDVHNQRTGICLDTAHAWGAGIALHDPIHVDIHVRPHADRIKLVHFNNSKHNLSSGRDGHGRLADGVLTPRLLEETYHLLRDALPDGTPFIIESTDDPAEIEMVQKWEALRAPAHP